jgi:hypothetical protein
MPRMKFDPAESEAKNAIVVSFDLTGFSDFCRRPDAYIVLPKFLSRLFMELNDFLMGEVDALFTKLDQAMGISSEQRKVVTYEGHVE